MERKFIDGYKDYAIYEDGSIFSTKRNRFLKPSFSSYGYHLVKLGGKNAKQFSVHRLVALAWIPNPENKRTVNHKNGIKTDNRRDNLEWMTIQENIQHAKETGLMPKGEDKITNLTNLQVVVIKQWLKYYKVFLIAKAFGVSREVIMAIKRNRTWTHV